MAERSVEIAWKVGFWYLAPGASTRITFCWYGRYNGLQFAEGRPWTATTQRRFEVTTVDRGLNFEFLFDNNVNDWRYFVDVINSGADDLFFTLEGGAVP